jgi:hypothetical protein
VKESAKKKKYSRDDEAPIAWEVASLSRNEEEKKNSSEQDVKPFQSYFYPVSQFSVKNYMFTKGVSLEFPDYLMMSRNYYDKKWSRKTHRRVKNVIITMDFYPSKAALKEIAAVGKPFTVEQENVLRRAFVGAGNEKSGATGSISVTRTKRGFESCGC